MSSVDRSIKSLRVMFWIFSVIGLGSLTTGAIAGLHMWHFVGNSLTAHGVVVGNVLQRGRGGYYSGCPKVRFSTQSGMEFVFVEYVCSRPPSYKAGDRVTVVYDHANPNHALIQQFSTMWFSSIYLSSIGILLLLVGFKCFQVSRKRGGHGAKTATVRKR